MLKTLSAAAFALAFAGSPAAATQPPTIEPFQVNAKNIGLCEIYNPNDLYSPGSALNPIGGIHLYVASHQKSNLTELELTDFSVKYLEQPLHGSIKSVAGKGAVNDFYVPNAGYAGNDRYVAEVAVKGIKFKVVGYIRPSSDVMSPFAVCRRTGLPGAAWKISDAMDANPGDTPLSMPASLAAALGDLELEMADLAGATVAQTRIKRARVSN